MTTATVKTSSGEVSGIDVDGVYAYLGMPFAEPPVGDLRFRPPVRRTVWSGVRPCTESGASMSQVILAPPVGLLFVPKAPPGADFLNLNVWTPDPGASGLPVVVWIHGGGFVIGAGSDPIYDGRAFARDGVVLVSVNYRLGAEGFMWFDGLPGAGSFGLLDQILALEWVQENVAGFGGDPGNVTIAGESAGGMCVSTLLAMPAARGLFRRAIPQSGAGHNAITRESAAAVRRYLATTAGVDDDVDAWRAVPESVLRPAEQTTLDVCLSHADRAAFGEIGAMAISMPWQPVYGTEDLPSRPIDAIAAGSASGVDVMVGTTAAEFVGPMKRVPQALGVPHGGDVADVGVELMATMVLGASGRTGKDIVDTYRTAERSNFDVLGQIISDWAFRIPAVRLAESHGDAFMYLVSWVGGGGEGTWGAGHALDLPLMFDTCDSGLGRWLTGPSVPPGLVDDMHGAWVRFATSGDPGWPRYDTDRRATMSFDVDSAVVDDPGGAERRLWDGVL